MRYALLTAGTILGFSFSVAAGLAQSSGGGASAGGQSGGASGGSATTTNPANTTSAIRSAGPGITAQEFVQIRPMLVVPSAPPLATATFPVTVGTVVPAETQVYTVPAQAVEVAPTIRGYQYVLVGNQVALVDPTTRRIVYVADR
jgi:Protein of unknown function (DUF1236)